MKKASSQKVRFHTEGNFVNLFSTTVVVFSGESWLGLEKLHQLTSNSSGSLRITLKDFDSNTYVAFYDQFQVRNTFSFSRGLVRDCPTLIADSFVVLLSYL